MKNYRVDPRTVDVPTDVLERIAECPTGGSGSGDYITGRIQSMARELLEYRKNKLVKEIGNGI